MISTQRYFVANIFGLLLTVQVPFRQPPHEQQPESTPSVQGFGPQQCKTNGEHDPRQPVKYRSAEQDLRPLHPDR